MVEPLNDELNSLLLQIATKLCTSFEQFVDFLKNGLIRENSEEERYKDLYSNRNTNIETFRYILALSLGIKTYLKNDLELPKDENYYSNVLGVSFIFASLLPAEKIFSMLHYDNVLFDYISEISNDNISTFLTTFNPQIKDYYVFQEIYNKVFSLVQRTIENYNDTNINTAEDISNFNSLIETFNHSRYCYEELEDILEFDFDYITNAMANTLCSLFNLPYYSKNKNMLIALIKSNAIGNLEDFSSIKEVHQLTNTTTNELFGYEVTVSTIESDTYQEAIEETAIIYPNGTLYETPGCAKSIITLLKLKLDKLFCFYDNNNEEPLKEDEYLIWSKKGEVIRLKRSENIYPNESISNILNISSQEEPLEL